MKKRVFIIIRNVEKKIRVYLHKSDKRRWSCVN